MAYHGVDNEAEPVESKAARVAMKRAGKAAANPYLDHLCTHFQPILMIGDQQESVWGYEALVRCARPYQHIGADLLLRTMTSQEEHYRLFEAVLDGALAMLKATDTPRVSVNVEPSLLSGRLEHHVRTALEKHEVQPQRLILELTERVNIAEQGSQGYRTLHNLVSAGVGVFLDDFFAGENSLDYLLKLEVSGVKIDKRLTQEAHLSKRGYHLLRSFVDMLGSCGMTGIVEGVETGEMLQAVKSAGANLAQGYFWGKPGPMGVNG
ncbi:MAG: EAL domain-containing protein [Gammaproteobacteria bacterium]|nr:MAG: EAL domain-containing protein [Gammaproteobacteria bacterium]